MDLVRLRILRLAQQFYLMTSGAKRCSTNPSLNKGQREQGRGLFWAGFSWKFFALDGRPSQAENAESLGGGARMRPSGDRRRCLG